MCLILLAHQSHPRYPLLVSANRDEFYHRPTRHAGFWPEEPQLLAGRDLEAGGTWLGLHRAGRFAAITNFRGPAPAPDRALSRGQLPLDFLRGDQGALEYAESILDRGEHYAGFNLLLLGDGELVYCSNVSGDARVLPPGIYGLSNALLDTAWPKVEIGRIRLEALLKRGNISNEDLAEVVSSQAFAPDSALPDTGVGLEAERWLSAQFIHSGEYGTRATTSLSIGSAGEVRFTERNFDRDGEAGPELQLEFSLG